VRPPRTNNHPHLPRHSFRYWEDLNQEERAKLLKDRLKLYTHKVGGRSEPEQTMG